MAAGILLVGYSRLWLGMRHPVDILAACAVGAVATRCIGPEREVPRRGRA